VNDPIRKEKGETRGKYRGWSLRRRGRSRPCDPKNGTVMAKCGVVLLPRWACIALQVAP